MIPGVIKSEIAYNIGENLPVVESSQDRAGWVIAEAKTREDAVESCEKALNTIKISTIPVE